MTDRAWLDIEVSTDGSIQRVEPAISTNRQVVSVALQFGGYQMFKLKRPCVNCPFRKGQGEVFQLSPERLTEIFEAGAFPCHKLVDYSEDEETGEEVHGMDRAQQCAGLMALLWKEGRPNQIMRIAMRLGSLEPDELDPDGEAYRSFGEARAAHRRGRRHA